MSDLSRGLQMICCSPPAARPMSPGGRFGHPVASVFPFGDGRPMSPVTTPPRMGAVLRDHVAVAVARQLYRANSVQGQTRRPAHRPVFVRHIETNAGLRNRLVEICRTTDRIRRTGSPVPCTAPAQTFSRPFSVWTTKLPDVRNAFRVRADVTSHRAEELVVSVRERRHLAIETISGSGSGADRIFHESTLPTGTRTKNLVADMSSESGVLNVRERAPEVAEVTFTNTGSASFVPIVSQDESRLELTIVLHVPRNFRFEDISVQTVDDRIVVTGRKRSLPPEVASNFRFEGSILPTFRASLQLPSGTDSRSVSALMTNHHQLLIRGTLGPLARRSTL